MGKRRHIRRALAGLILLLILIGAGWTGLWYIVAGRLADHVAAWEQQQRAAGWTISHGAPSRTGWPMAAGVTLPDVSASGAANVLPGGIVWTAKALTLALDIRHPNDLFLGVMGKETLSVADTQPIPFQATRLTGRVELLPGGHPGLVQLHATGFLAALDDGSALSATDIGAALRADRTATSGGNALVIAANARGIGLPSDWGKALGPSVRTLAVDVAVSGPWPSESDPGTTATAWRDGGGTLTLRQFHLLYGPLTADATGRLQPDAAMQLGGDIAVHATGLDESLDRLAAARDIPRSVAVAVKAMLGLLTRPQSTGALDAGLTLRAGVISLGAVPLLRLPD